MTERPLILRYAARSDVGMVRAKNDDSAYAGKYLAVVADGMGGHAGGDVASASTVLDLIHLDRDGYQGDAGTRLADEIQTANSLLSELVHINPKLAGMGTTVTALLLTGDKLAYAHIGDSRAYRIKDGIFEQMSTDHTFVQRMIDEGRLRPEEAETHPHKNVLMRVLGDVDASPELDLKTFDATPGERWLLCSDGLNFVRTEMVEEVLRTTKDLGSCADTLIELTLAVGSPDNVTVVVFEVAEQSQDDTSTAAIATVSATHPAPSDDEDSDEDDYDENDSEDDSENDSDDESENEDGGTGPNGKADGLGSHITAEVIRQELAERPHELVGAAVTAHADGKIPVLEGHPAVKRAATVLTHKPKPQHTVEMETEESLPRAKYRTVLLSVIGGVLVIAVAAGIWFGYLWTQTLYYVGTSNGHVAIYDGVSQSLGPIQLSHIYRETDISVASLPPYSQQRLAQTLPAQDLNEANQIISDLQLGIGPSTPPCAVTPFTPGQTGQSTASASAHGTASATKKATSTSKATAKSTAKSTTSPSTSTQPPAKPSNAFEATNPATANAQSTALCTGSAP